MTSASKPRMIRSTASVALASVGGILYWGLAFYVSNLPWLVAVSAPPAASRVAFTLWQDRLPGLVWTALEFAVLAFRFGLVVVVVGLARGTGERIPGLPAEWLPDVLAAVERSLANWPVVLWQLLVVGVAALAVNASVTYAVVPSLAAHVGGEIARAASFAFKNLVVIPLFVVYLYAIFVRQFA